MTSRVNDVMGFGNNPNKLCVNLATYHILRVCGLLRRPPTRRAKRKRKGIQTSITRLGLANARSVNRKAASIVEHIDSLHLGMLVICGHRVVADRRDR